MNGITICVLERVQCKAAVAFNITGCFDGRKYTIIVVI
jgi:hypothetical protein